jgi:outer membrane immunogenic protein
MKAQLLATCVLLASAGSAFAADPGVPLEEPPVGFSWTGAYVGGQVGYMWSRGDGDYIDIFEGDFGSVFNESTSVDSDGWLVGGQVGYNYQINNWVLGVEGEFAWSDSDGQNLIIDDTNGAQVATENVDLNWLGSLTARAGFAAERTLFYAKAGVGFTDIELKDIGLSGAVGATGSDTLTGWTLGAGAEHAFTDRWSVRGEYQFYSFDADATLDRVEDGAPFRTYDGDLDIHAIKFGVNYRF